MRYGSWLHRHVIENPTEARAELTSARDPPSRRQLSATPPPPPSPPTTTTRQHTRWARRRHNAHMQAHRQAIPLEAGWRRRGAAAAGGFVRPQRRRQKDHNNKSGNALRACARTESRRKMQMQHIRGDVGTAAAVAHWATYYAEIAGTCYGTVAGRKCAVEAVVIINLCAPPVRRSAGVFMWKLHRATSAYLTSRVRGAPLSFRPVVP